ncbi:MAG: glycoside hydrolase family 2 protein, partial [Clostridia bacterium]
GPVLPPSGISGDIYIECSSTAKVTDICVVQHHIGDVFELDIDVACKTLSCTKDVKYKLEFTAPNGKTTTLQGDYSEDIRLNLTVKNPQIWWTRELSGRDEQPLYEVLVTLEKCGQQISKKQIKIGLRTIELNRNCDKYGNNFQFILNDAPIFAKGADWIPADSFVNRFDEKKLNDLLSAVLFSNMNMLRVWGGGYYESDMFYEKCDKLGILVWQDFGFACQAYPFFDDTFLDNVKREVEFNAKRLRSHASLALWCGNNEIESMSALWLAKRNYVRWTDKFFYDILPKTLKKFDVVTPYIEGSPCGKGFSKGINSDDTGDTHLWAVWHGLQPLNYYRKRLTRFCSEFGFESIPNLSTVRKFATDSDFSLGSKVMKAHQKCASGNKKMAFYIASKYRLPDSFKDYIYLSQLCQQECISDATEHWRRNKGRCNGALYWQLNDCWPVCSWSSIDYFGGYKALQYTSRRFFQPQSISIENNKDNIKVFVLNDVLDRLMAKVTIKIVDFYGTVYLNEAVKCNVESNSVKQIFEKSIKEIRKLCNLKDVVFVAEMNVGDTQISKKTCLFVAEKNANLPKAQIEKEVKIENGTAYIKLKSTKFARSVTLSSSGDEQHFSDNCFDLLPNESVSVTAKIEGSEENFKNQLEVYDLSQVKARGNKLGDFATRARVFLEPINFFSWISYIRIGKPKK